MERAAAARDWCAWEDAITPTTGPSPRFAEPAFRLAFARIVAHYWSQGHFLGPDGALLAATGRFGEIA
ncbi:MAG: hypothetical protein ACRDSK_23470 [Actinophytocola sp.]|uniref:hypothetical protein n=1 Tax=Actinophytocola sp. TaxID=1872138 RepID=UPI003D6AE69C